MKRHLALTLIFVSLMTLSVGCESDEHTTHYLESRTVREPSCTEEGLEEIYCIHCDYSETRSIPIAHKYESLVLKESTCTEKGTVRYKCSICNDTYDDDLKLANHIYVDKKCSVCGAKKVGTITTRGTYQQFDYGSWETVVSTCKITYLKGEIDEYGLMKVYFQGVKTYDWNGENGNKPCSFMMVVKDDLGKILHSEQIMTDHIVEGEEFKFYVQLRDYYDDSLNYTIELSDYMM